MSGFDAAAVTILAVAGFGFFWRFVIGPSLADRVVALDGLMFTIVSAVVLAATDTGNTRFLDVAVAIAFVGFVGTAAAARYIDRRGG